MKRLLTLTAALAALAMPAAAQECEDGFRTFGHELGTACIPVDPERVVSGNEFWITVPLVELNAPLVGTAGHDFGSELDYFARLEGLGLSHLVPGDIPSVGRSAGMDLEVIASLEPDLIITTIYEADLHERLELIAPTVIVPAGTLAKEHLAFIADAVGAMETHEALIADYERRIALIREQLVAPEEISISRLDIDENGLWYLPDFGAQDQVINDLGFSRPEIQRDATSNIRGMSLENIEAFDGDLILTGYAPRFGQTVEMLRDDWMAEGGALWTQLDGVQAGNHFWYERDTWNAIGYHFLNEVVSALALITVGREFD